MSYISLYRKWRPLSFDEVVGQETTVRVLKNTIMSGKIAHAYLFCGTRGTGKTSIAKIFSRAINCTESHDGNPCNKCEICRGLLDGSLPDVMEIDAASNNGVDNIRAIIEDSVYSTFKAKYRVYIIDEVHMLSAGAFNALLKTLEEPPENVVFILATTEPQKLPATIISRCIRFNFKRIPIDAAAARLAEICDSIDVQYDDEALFFLARKGEGALRDAISLLDQTISSSDGYITLEKAREATGNMDRSFTEKLAMAIIESNGAEILKSVNDIFAGGTDPAVMISELISVFRDIMVTVTVRNPAGMVESSGDVLRELAKKTSAHEVVFFIKELSALENRMKWSIERKTVFEAGLLGLCDRHFSEDDDIVKRLSFLEERVADLVASGIKISSSAVVPSREENRTEEIKKDKKEKKKTDTTPEEQPLKEGKREVSEENSGKPEKMADPDRMDFKSGLISRQRNSAASIIDANASLYVKGNDLYIVFENAIMMSMVKNQQNQPILEASAEEACGKKMKIHILIQKDYEAEISTMSSSGQEKKDENAGKNDSDRMMEELARFSAEQGFEIVEK